MPDQYPPTRSDFNYDRTPVWVPVLLGIIMVFIIPAVVIIGAVLM